MKILLVYNYTIVEPLGVLFLADYIQRNHHEADLIDYQSLEKKNLDYHSYDFVGFSILTGSHNPMFKLADKIRGKVKIAIGGPHTISFAEDCAQHADFVVRGFGERILLKILNGEITKAGIYSESVPPKDLLISGREKFYRDETRRNNPLKNVITGFCCPFNCTYCYNSIVQEEFPAYRYAQRPVDSVIKECRTLLEYPLKVIVFQDDTFGVNIDWLKEFAKNTPKKSTCHFTAISELNWPRKKESGYLKRQGASVSLSL